MLTPIDNARYHHDMKNSSSPHRAACDNGTSVRAQQVQLLLLADADTVNLQCAVEYLPHKYRGGEFDTDEVRGGSLYPFIFPLRDQVFWWSCILTRAMKSDLLS